MYLQVTQGAASYVLYVVIGARGWQPPAPQSKKEMIQKIKSFGEFNNWRGFIGLYLTSKEGRQLKKYGITSETTIRDAYEILCNK